MLNNLEHIKEALRPYIDIILFVVALLAANYFWKFTVLGDESGIQVTWFGLDITRPFDAMAHHITSIVYGLLSLTNEHVHFLEPNTLRFDTGTSTKIVWSCTALKQSFIWIVIMLVARGSWKRKLWFIPLGLACAYLFNIVRITQTDKFPSDNTHKTGHKHDGQGQNQVLPPTAQHT